MFHFDLVWYLVDVVLFLVLFQLIMWLYLISLYCVVLIWAFGVPLCYFLTILIQLLGFLHYPYIFTNPLLI